LTPDSRIVGNTRLRDNRHRRYALHRYSAGKRHRATGRANACADLRRTLSGELGRSAFSRALAVSMID